MNENFYINLIYKNLSAEISPAEKEQLEAWLQQSEENRAMAASIEKAWQASDLLQADVNVDLDTEFGELETLIGKEEKAVKDIIVPLNRTYRWVGIAASIATLVILAFLIRDRLSESSGTVEAEMLVLQTDEKTQKVILPDGSTVILNRNSQLTYPKEFDKQKRRVQLEGEGYFQVEHDAAHPFEVNTINETVRVLGTSFNVQSGDEGTTTVYVAEGKVAFAQNEGKQKVILTRGEKGISASGKIIEIKATDNELAWYTGRLEFVDTPIKEVKEAIEQYYEVSLVVENPAILNCTFTATFEEETIAIVLDILGTVLDFEWEKSTDNQYILKGGACD
jgi:transmembrane sensor